MAPALSIAAAVCRLLSSSVRPPVSRDRPSRGTGGSRSGVIAVSPAWRRCCCLLQYADASTSPRRGPGLSSCQRSAGGSGGSSKSAETAADVRLMGAGSFAFDRGTSLAAALPAARRRSSGAAMSSRLYTRLSDTARGQLQPSCSAHLAGVVHTRLLHTLQLAAGTVGDPPGSTSGAVRRRRSERAADPAEGVQVAFGRQWPPAAAALLQLSYMPCRHCSASLWHIVRREGRHPADL